MTPASCLHWIMSGDSKSASDIITAANAVDWVCDKAVEFAETDWQREEIEVERRRFEGTLEYRHFLPELCGPFGKVNSRTHDERVRSALLKLCP